MRLSRGLVTGIMPRRGTGRFIAGVGLYTGVLSILSRGEETIDGLTSVPRGAGAPEMVTQLCEARDAGFASLWFLQWRSKGGSNRRSLSRNGPVFPTEQEVPQK
jgi:hypothetical protein